MDYDINESPKLELLVTPADATIDSLEISDNDIANFEYTDGQAIVTFVNEGTETITFIVNGSIESNATTITVVDQAKKEAEEESKKKAEEEAKKKAEEEAKKKAEEEAKKKAEEEAQKKAEEEAQKKVEEQAALAEAERIAAEQAEAEQAAQAAAQQPQEEMVWISGNGKKYHSRSSCSNMKNPSQVPLSEAQKTREPCKKCY